jgi:PPOX class probable F420-dependent enzyme
MSAVKTYASLDELPAHTAVLPTTRKDGRPIGAPIWYVRDGDELALTTWAESLKGKALRRDPRIALTVQDPQPPFSYVIAEGEAPSPPQRSWLAAQLPLGSLRSPCWPSRQQRCGQRGQTGRRS